MAAKAPLRSVTDEIPTDQKLKLALDSLDVTKLEAAVKVAEKEEDVDSFEQLLNNAKDMIRNLNELKSSLQFSSISWSNKDAQQNGGILQEKDFTHLSDLIKKAEQVCLVDLKLNTIM